MYVISSFLRTVISYLCALVLSIFLEKFPNSLLATADKYLNGGLYLIIAWLFVLLMIYFFILTLRIFFKK